MFNFTHEERRVLLFLISMVIMGMAVNFLGKKYSPDKAFYNLSEDITKIDLNTADKDLLMSVPGIGEKLAQRIIDYREKHAGFHTVEELKSITGITDYRYDKTKDYLIIK